MEPKTKEHPAGSRTKNLRGTNGAKDNDAPRRKPHDAPRGNGWTRGQRRTPQEAARRPYVERIEKRTKRTYVERIKKRTKRTCAERIEKRIEGNSFCDMFFVYLVRPNAQHCFAADAAGAAPELGAILGHDGAPALVPVGGGRQRRR